MAVVRNALGWLALAITQPIVWAVLAGAAIASWPFELFAQFCRRRLNKLAGKHVLITGGSEGVGLELASLCAQQGARVSIVARTESKLQSARDAICAASADAKVAIASADVGVGSSLAAAVARCEAECGPVDVVIAAAGAAIVVLATAARASDPNLGRDHLLPGAVRMPMLQTIFWHQRIFRRAAVASTTWTRTRIC